MIDQTKLTQFENGPQQGCDCAFLCSSTHLHAAEPQHQFLPILFLSLPMPTITLQVGQCGNQLGSTLWELLKNQQQHCSSSSSSSLLSHEWFASVRAQQQQQHVLQRCVCIDSEAKVVKRWEQQDGSSGEQASNPQQQAVVHMLGRGGGCGNNWWVNPMAFAVVLGLPACARQGVHVL